MKKILFWLFVFLIFSFQDAFSFSIEPARIELVIPAGRQKGKTILIDNSKADTPLHVRIYPQDIADLPDGTHDFLPIGSTDWSCSSWIKVVPEELDIPAGKAKSVRVSVEIPLSVRGGRYSTLFFEAGLPGQSKGIGVNLRIGAMVLVTVPGTENFKARLSNISFTPPRDIEVSIFNEGNVLLRPAGKIKILAAKGKRIKSLDFNPQKLSILPGSLRKFNLQLGEALPKGVYTLRAEIDFGEEYLLVGELPVNLE